MTTTQEFAAEVRRLAKEQPQTRSTAAEYMRNGVPICPLGVALYNLQVIDHRFGFEPYNRRSIGWFYEKPSRRVEHLPGLTFDPATEQPARLYLETFQRWVDSGYSWEQADGQASIYALAFAVYPEGSAPPPPMPDLTPVPSPWVSA